MGTMYSDVQHYLYGGEGEMMIFLLHCYSTAAMPYMGAQGGVWNCPSLNISLGALDTIRTVTMKLLH